jgi:hypothetical protein
MTRKDFERIACILSYTDIKDEDSITMLLRETNPNFNKERFWKAVFEYQNGQRVLK